MGGMNKWIEKSADFLIKGITFNEPSSFGIFLSAKGYIVVNVFRKLLYIGVLDDQCKNEKSNRNKWIKSQENRNTKAGLHARWAIKDDSMD